LQTIVSREVRPGDPAVVTVGSIHGGTKSNIISDEVRLQLTLRSYKTETRQHLIDSIKRIVKAQAESAGMPADKMPEVIVSDDQTPALYNQPALCAEVRRHLDATLGEANVLTREPVMGAEDFAEYGLTKEKVPLCMFWLGTQPPDVVAEAKSERHHAAFAALALLQAHSRAQHRDGCEGDDLGGDRLDGQVRPAGKTTGRPGVGSACFPSTPNLKAASAMVSRGETFCASAASPWAVSR
jgi:metal-dependent amidase/aminoacylase/carboxypeptidase family protein